MTDNYRTITVLGGDRDANKNEKVGGAKGSLHERGQAADISVEGISNEALAYEAKNFNKFSEVIFYPNWGDTKGFSTHDAQMQLVFGSGSDEIIIPFTYRTPNSQKLAPHLHLGYNPSKHFLGRYTGFDPTRKKGRQNTYAPWISPERIR